MMLFRNESYHSISFTIKIIDIMNYHLLNVSVLQQVYVLPILIILMSLWDK